MDVRDAMSTGKKTIIISTGGIEPNGPWLALGKHNYILKANCDAIAGKLGDALCAPIIPFFPEGSIEPKSGHMKTAGTISLRQESFEALLTDIAHSFKVNGFENIILIGDSGGNMRGIKAVATKLNAEWKANPVVAHIPEYYQFDALLRHFREKGDIPENLPSDGLHDDFWVTLNMMAGDLNSVRWDALVAAGKATINGMSIADKEKSLKLAAEIVEFRANAAVTAIKRTITDQGKTNE